MELHVWGNEAEIGTFDVESIACVILINYLKQRSGLDAQIVMSCNTGYLELFYKFPFLKDTEDDNRVIEGYWPIVRHLKGRSSELDVDSWLTGQDIVLNRGLVNFVSDKVIAISHYNYFLNKTNYDKYTISRFRHYLRFPLQYYIPLSVKAHATDQCGLAGFSPAALTDSYLKQKEENKDIAKKKMELLEQELGLPSIETVNDEQTKKRMANLTLLKDTSQNYKVLQALEKHFTKIDVKQSFFKGETQFVFGDQMASCDPLLIGFLMSSMNEKLPDTFLSSFIKVRYPSLVQTVENAKELYL